MKFAQIVFFITGLYGLATLTPTLFLEDLIGATDPPALTHPEYFYGFLAVALAWQVMFVAIAMDPRRLRPAMPIGVLEKVGFGMAVALLFVQHRVGGGVLALGAVDVVLGALMLVAFLRAASVPATRALPVDLGQSA